MNTEEDLNRHCTKLYIGCTFAPAMYALAFVIISYLRNKSNLPELDVTRFREKSDLSRLRDAIRDQRKISFFQPCMLLFGGLCCKIEILMPYMADRSITKSGKTWVYGANNIASSPFNDT